MEEFLPKAAQTPTPLSLRRRSNARAASLAPGTSGQYYQSLYEQNPSMYFTVDADGMVLSINQFGAEQLGYSTEELTGRSVLEIFHPRDQSAVREHLSTCLAHPGKVHQWELRKVRKDGTELWVKETARSIEVFGRTPIVLIVCEDISRRRRAESALRRNERMVSASRDMMALIDKSHCYVTANAAYAEAFGTTADAIIGRHVSEVIGKKVFALRTKAHMSRCLMGKRVNYQHWMELPGQGLRYLDVHCDPFIDTDGNITGIVEDIRDLTEHKQAETELQQHQQQLRKLASEMSLAEERERRRIAVELHDRIVQDLALSQIKLAALRKTLAAGTQCSAAREIQAIINKIILDTRTLVFELSPPILYELGFEPAIEWLAERLEEKHGVICRVVNDGRAEPLKDNLQVVLFQAVRELLANVAKHADATRVNIRVSKEDGVICICLDDDGVGFDVSAAAACAVEHGSFGLFSIRERLDMLGGQVEINSVPGKGTRVTLAAPLTSDAGV